MKRDELTIEKDRARIASLLKRGIRSKEKIAQIINSERDGGDNYVSTVQVEYDIRTIKENYKDQQLEDFVAFRNEAIDRLFNLMETLWEAYDKSCKNEVIIESEVVADEDEYDAITQEGMQLAPNAERVFLRNAKVKERIRPEGNHAFLQQIFQIEEKLSKIYGFDMPSKISLTDPSGENEAASPLADVLGQLEALNKNTDRLLPEHNQTEEEE